jgi:hypothetical protein
LRLVIVHERQRDMNRSRAFRRGSTDQRHQKGCCGC